MHHPPSDAELARSLIALPQCVCSTLSTLISGEHHSSPRVCFSSMQKGHDSIHVKLRDERESANSPLGEILSIICRYLHLGGGGGFRRADQTLTNRFVVPYLLEAQAQLNLRRP